MTTRLEVRWLAEADDDTLRDLAASFAGLDPASVRVVRACRSCGSDQHGKPQVVRSDDGPPVHVSLSRSHETAVIVATDAGPVGVDVEREDADPDVDAWVRHEAAVKASGHGLTVSPEPSSTPRWTFDLDAPAGFIACATVLADASPRLVPAAPAG